MNNIRDEIIKRVRASFANLTWKKILTFSFFIFISATFWLMQVYRQPFESTLNIPLKYVNIPDSIVFDNELPSSVTIRIKDDGSALFRYFFTKSKDTISVDVGKIIRGNNSNIIQNVAYEELLRSKLLNSSEIKSYFPSRISFEHSVLVHKKVPVVFDGHVIIDPGYILTEDIQIQPDSVTIYGSNNSLEKIENVYTVSDTIRNLTKAVSLPVKLKLLKNIRHSPSEIKLNIPIDNYTEKKMTVPITCVNLPEDMVIKLFPSNITVSFNVGVSQYKEISESDFLIELNYNDLKELKTVMAPVRLISSPMHINNISLSPSEVEFVFEKK